MMSDSDCSALRWHSLGWFVFSDGNDEIVWKSGLTD